LINSAPAQMPASNFSWCRGMTRTPTKVTRIRRATDLMRAGSALLQMHNARGIGWYLVPGGEVEENVAVALLERPDIQPAEDGLFPGSSQTFKFTARPRKRMAASHGAMRTTPSEIPAPLMEVTMGDEFETETDLDNTPTEDDLAEAYGSKSLGVVDVGGKKIRTKISKVRMEEVKDRETGKTRKRAIVFFENIDKGLVLNTTNKETLKDAFGKKPADWRNATVGIYVDPNVMFGGKKTGGVRLRALPPSAAPAKPAPAPQPASKPPAAAASEWPEEKGDPGFDPDDFNTSTT
jgi:hypothetical protein